MPSAPFCYPIVVEEHNIDELGHANNAVYLTWIQAAVTSHWRDLAPAEAVAAYRWIAVQHEITYRKPALVGDELTALLVLDRVRRESAFYTTHILRSDELIANAKSRWCCIDAETLRPERLSQNVIAHFLDGPTNGLESHPALQSSARHESDRRSA